MRWRRFFQRRQSDAELQQEMELHMEEGIAEKIERGMAKDEAPRRAYLKFGNARRVRKEVWRGSTFLRVERMWGRSALHGEEAEEGTPSCADGDGFAGPGNRGECIGLLGRK